MVFIINEDLTHGIRLSKILLSHAIRYDDRIGTRQRTPIALEEVERKYTEK